MRTGKKLLASAAISAGTLALVVTSLGAAQANNSPNSGGFGEGKRGGSGTSLVATGNLSESERTAVREAMRAAMADNKADSLANLVSEGVLTQAQAETLQASQGQRGAMRSLLTDGTLTRDQVQTIRDSWRATKSDHHDQVLDQLVAAGTITQAQADAIKEHKSSATQRGKGMGKGHGNRR